MVKGLLSTDRVPVCKEEQEAQPGRQGVYNPPGEARAKEQQWI